MREARRGEENMQGCNLEETIDDNIAPCTVVDGERKVVVRDKLEAHLESPFSCFDAASPPLVVAADMFAAASRRRNGGWRRGFA